MPPTRPDTIDNRYRVLKALGRGGMGAVYLVRESKSQNLYALKVLHEESLMHAATVARFMAEMKLPAKIGSEHIVAVVSSGSAPELGGAPYLVMELLRGCDLSRLIEQHRAISVDEVLWITRLIGKALDKAHAAGVIHRDLKPENVFLHQPNAGELTVKLLDFGIARITADARGSVAINRGGATTSTVGTPLYMSPEQAQGPSSGSAAIGPGVDVWALGMMVFELLAGEPYWTDETGNALSIMFKIVTAQQLSPPSKRKPGLPPRLDAWFQRSCARDPQQRWASVGEQAEALVAALGKNAAPLQAPHQLAKKVAALTPKLPAAAFEQTRTYSADALNLGLSEEKTVTEESLNSQTAQNNSDDAEAKTLAEQPSSIPGLTAAQRVAPVYANAGRAVLEPRPATAQPTGSSTAEDPASSAVDDAQITMPIQRAASLRPYAASQDPRMSIDRSDLVLDMGWPRRPDRAAGPGPESSSRLAETLRRGRFGLPPPPWAVTGFRAWLRALTSQPKSTLSETPRNWQIVILGAPILFIVLITLLLSAIRPPAATGMHEPADMGAVRDAFVETARDAATPRDLAQPSAQSTPKRRLPPNKQRPTEKPIKKSDQRSNIKKPVIPLPPED